VKKKFVNFYFPQYFLAGRKGERGGRRANLKRGGKKAQGLDPISVLCGNAIIPGSKEEGGGKGRGTKTQKERKKGKGKGISTTIFSPTLSCRGLGKGGGGKKRQD